MRILALTFFALTCAFFRSNAQNYDSIQLMVENDLARSSELKGANDDQKDGSPRKEIRCSFLILSNLAKAAEILSETEAFDCLNTSLGSLESQVPFLEEKFEALHSHANGSIKTESLKSAEIHTFSFAELRYN